MKVEIKLIIVLAIAFILGKYFPGTFYILDVHAVNDDSWFNEIEHYGATTFYFYNHNSNGYSEMSSSTYQMTLQYQYVQDSNDYLERTFWFPYVSSANIATNGVSISYYVEQLFAQGYLYNLTSYVCFGTSANNVTASVTTGYSATNAIGHSMGYHTTVKQAVASQNWGDSTLSNCYAITSLISSTGTYPWVNLKFTNSTNLQTNIKFIGYSIEALGIYNASLQQYVQNAINNSGLATANSVTEVNSAVQYVQTQMNDMNDTLTQDHNYNNNASTNVPGNNEVDDLSDAESELFDNIDLSGVEDLNISINPNANNFIWEIVNQLRAMNSNIILLITSALGLGIIKMILNR